METTDMQLGSIDIASSGEHLVTPKFNTLPLRFLGYFAIATLLPLSALIIYMSYAVAQGIVLESGCHGPGIPFSLFSGVLFAMQLRVFEINRPISPE